MKIPFRRLALLVPLLLGGCSSMNPFSSGGREPPSSPDEYVEEAVSRPGTHLGQLISAFGPVIASEEREGWTVFTLSSNDRSYWFQVSYPGPLPEVRKNVRVHFVGRITGAARLIQGRHDATLLIDGLAVMIRGADRPVYRPGQRKLAEAWLNGELAGRDPGAP